MTWKDEGFQCEEFYTAPYQELKVVIRQVSPKELRNILGKAGNAGFDRERGIITVRRMFTDQDYMTFGSLGHEVWHALGGRHRGG